jgi:hypothetical protein
VKKRKDLKGQMEAAVVVVDFTAISLRINFSTQFFFGILRALVTFCENNHCCQSTHRVEF